MWKSSVSLCQNDLTLALLRSVIPVGAQQSCLLSLQLSGWALCGCKLWLLCPAVNVDVQARAHSCFLYLPSLLFFFFLKKKKVRLQNVLSQLQAQLTDFPSKGGGNKQKKCKVHFFFSFMSLLVPSAAISQCLPRQLSDNFFIC